MPDTPDIASFAALVGEPTRAAMLIALMDGRAHTTTELAIEGGITPGTASVHLTRMTDGGLLTIARQGRHRYYRLATPAIASALEGLMRVSPPGARREARPGPADEDLRRARLCYDHLAGEAGVTLLDRLRAQRFIKGGEDSGLKLTAGGETWCARIGIDLDGLRARRRPLCRPCLDWSERRMHLAGALGAALLERMVALRYVRRSAGSRVLAISPRGSRFLTELA